MSDLLKKLFELHKIDQNINRLTDRYRTIPKRIEALEDGFKRRKSDIDRHKDNLKEYEHKRRTLEMDIEEAESKILTYKLQLQKVKTNDEYRGLEAQIEYQQNKISEIETEEIKILDEVDLLNRELKDLEERIKSDEERYNNEKIKLTEEEKRSIDMIDKLSRQKIEISGEIEPRIIKKYERIKKAKKIAIGTISEIESIGPLSKNNMWICNGCNSTLPPQIVEEVKINNRILTCEACGRILYYDENEI